jgi:hypothetical protein
MQAYLHNGSLVERLGLIFSGALVTILPVAAALIVLQPL